MDLDLQRDNALLRATLREILRIADAASADSQCVPFDAALEGQPLRDWRRILPRAKLLAQSPLT